MPLYALWQDDNLFRIGGYVAHCTLGDVVIATAAYVAVAVIFQRVDWPAHFLLRGAAVLLGIGIAYTAFSEWYNVYQVNAWAYTPQMPLVGGIGVTLMLQWLVVPTLMLWRLRWTTGTRFSASVKAGVWDKHETSSLANTRR